MQHKTQDNKTTKQRFEEGLRIHTGTHSYDSFTCCAHKWYAPIKITGKKPIKPIQVKNPYPYR